MLAEQGEVYGYEAAEIIRTVAYRHQRYCFGMYNH